MVLPGFVSQAERTELRHPLAICCLAIESLRRIGMAVADIGAGVPAGGVADAAKAAVTGGDMSLQHRAGAGAEHHVDIGHDGGAGAGRAVKAAGARRRHAIGELRLAHRPHLGRTVGAIHRAAVDIDRRGDVVAGAGVFQQLVQQVTMVGVVPQMMVGIDDGQVRLDDRLRRLLGQPCCVGHERAPLPLDPAPRRHRFHCLFRFDVSMLQPRFG
jgi:hypothetical protein